MLQWKCGKAMTFFDEFVLVFFFVVVQCVARRFVMLKMYDADLWQGVGGMDGGFIYQTR